jgi:hypothetical protein
MKFRVFISCLSLGLALVGCFRDDGVGNNDDNANLDSLQAGNDNRNDDAGTPPCHELSKEQCHRADGCRPQWGEECDDEGCHEVVNCVPRERCDDCEDGDDWNHPGNDEDDDDSWWNDDDEGDDEDNDWSDWSCEDIGPDYCEWAPGCAPYWWEECDEEGECEEEFKCIEDENSDNDWGDWDDEESEGDWDNEEGDDESWGCGDAGPDYCEWIPGCVPHWWDDCDDNGCEEHFECVEDNEGGDWDNEEGNEDDWDDEEGGDGDWDDWDNEEGGDWENWGCEDLGPDFCDWASECESHWHEACDDGTCEATFQCTPHQGNGGPGNNEPEDNEPEQCSDMGPEECNDAYECVPQGSSDNFGGCVPFWELTCTSLNEEHCWERPDCNMSDAGCSDNSATSCNDINDAGMCDAVPGCMALYSNSCSGCDDWEFVTCTERNECEGLDLPECNMAPECAANFSAPCEDCEATQFAGCEQA